jgi:DNA-binding NarL/FixJ family response regulator
VGVSGLALIPYARRSPESTGWTGPSLVDDHDGFRKHARRLLEAAGYSVVGEASDGASAIAGAFALRPDADGLPDADGFEVAVALAAAVPRTAVGLTEALLAESWTEATRLARMWQPW